MRFLLATPLRRTFCLVVLGLAMASTAMLSLTEAQSSPRTQAELVAAFETATSNRLLVSQSRATSNYSFVKALQGETLVADDVSASPEARAWAFLKEYGTLVAVGDAERELALVRVEKDDLGGAHVRFDQRYQGLPVFGAQLIVHMDGKGITGINGNFVPAIAVPTSPVVKVGDASKKALAEVRAASKGEAHVVNVTLAVYRTGLLEGYVGENRLAYAFELRGPTMRRQVWIDALTGVVLNNISLIHEDLHRVVYSPNYDPNNPALYKQREEGGLPNPLPPVNNLYEFAGQTYRFFHNAFGRDSYDDGENDPVNGKGAKMISVYLVNEACPNAYWNGVSTNYCPGFDVDDVVAHEWGHAYTEYTHGLVYQYQSGALNESYSDIWGESVDLLNQADGVGGNNNSEPYPDGQRWLVGEDLGQAVQELLLRDMWNPDRLGAPGKVSSSNYYCSSDDGGGVHTNSGVPNHGFALLTDGGSYNGQIIAGLGLTKTSHIYFKAMTDYQIYSSNFNDHADGLVSACSDLIGTPLTSMLPLSGPRTGGPSSTAITAADCAELPKMIAAIELRQPPACVFKPVLAPNAPAVCANAPTAFQENWETGADGWTFDSVPASSPYGTGWDPNRFRWVLTSTLPAPYNGMAMFAIDPTGGTCGGTEDYSGTFSMMSPVITLTSQITSPQLRFDHWVATELAVDGGNLQVSVNGGSFSIVPESAYTFNAPNTTLRAAPPTDQNTNPMAGQIAWSGTDEGAAGGSWGTTLVNLNALSPKPQTGDRLRFRWQYGMDGCGGVTGWYVDNISLYSCPVATVQTVSLARRNNYKSLPGGALGLAAKYFAQGESGNYQWTVTPAANNYSFRVTVTHESGVNIIANRLADNVDGATYEIPYATTRSWLPGSYTFHIQPVSIGTTALQGAPLIDEALMVGVLDPALEARDANGDSQTGFESGDEVRLGGQIVELYDSATNLGGTQRIGVAGTYTMTLRDSANQTLASTTGTADGQGNYELVVASLNPTTWTNPLRARIQAAYEDPLLPAPPGSSWRGQDEVLFSLFFWADVNRSCGAVDVNDIQATANAWQQAAGGGSVSTAHDVDNQGQGDGDNDIADVQAVAGQFGVTRCNTAP